MSSPNTSTSFAPSKTHLRNRSSQFQFKPTRPEHSLPHPGTRPCASTTPAAPLHARMTSHDMREADKVKFKAFKFPRTGYPSPDANNVNPSASFGKPPSPYLPSPPSTPATESETISGECCDECCSGLEDINVRYTSAFTSKDGRNAAVKDAYSTYSYPYAYHHESKDSSSLFFGSASLPPRTQALQLVPMTDSLEEDSSRSSSTSTDEMAPYSPVSPHSSHLPSSPYPSRKDNSEWSSPPPPYTWSGFSHRVRQSISFSIDLKGSLPTHFGLSKNLSPSSGKSEEGYYTMKLRGAHTPTSGVRGGGGGAVGTKFFDRLDTIDMGKFGRLATLVTLVLRRMGVAGIGAAGGGGRQVSPKVIRMLTVSSWVMIVALLGLALWFVIKGC
ncbi:hypothetical protein K435DRAFT_790032 [Dendrothele bispora CBS 962.96]|uniref:Uncharacterized protein n=1 Tax=Dendrothele bispora (strain CBS 962.96) TaxID=1314807 RepID=A0A4S8MRY2_DENBC|nr:hypothetical protein K435DRAFT_790032 [Dendrothele bispora CBS 962.96]